MQYRFFYICHLRKKEGIRLSPKPDPVYKTNLTNRHEKIFSNVWCKYNSLNHFNKTIFNFFC